MGGLLETKEMILIVRHYGFEEINFQAFKTEELVVDPDLTFTYQSQGNELDK